MKFASHIIRIIIVILFALGMAALMNIVPPTMIVTVLAAMLAGYIFDEVKSGIDKDKSNNI